MSQKELTDSLSELFAAANLEAADVECMESAGPSEQCTDVDKDEIQIENLKSIEIGWVTKAVEHMTVHFNLLCSVDPKALKLTSHDDKIYEEFRKHFCDFNVEIVTVESLKSEDCKRKWRSFCNIFTSVVEDASYGTLLRLNCHGDYSEENTILVLRIQFLAIEIARNREGYNDEIRVKFSRTLDKQSEEAVGNETEDKDEETEKYQFEETEKEQCKNAAKESEETEGSSHEEADYKCDEAEKIEEDQFEYAKVNYNETVEIEENQIEKSQSEM